MMDFFMRNGFKKPVIAGTGFSKLHDGLERLNGGFFEESGFIDLLIRERRRTERSKKPILLVLINIEKLIKSDSYNAVIQFLSLLTASNRETDIKGWYRINQIVGIIYTDIKDDLSTKETIINYYEQRVQNGAYDDLKDKITLSFYSFPDSTDEETGEASKRNEFLYPDISQTPINKKIPVCCKRIIDIMGSIAGIILFSPIFIVIALLVKMTSKGPVFFRQERVGYEGKRFMLLKFRSMNADNDETIHKDFVKNFIRSSDSATSDNGVYKIVKDPRG